MMEDSREQYIKAFLKEMKALPAEGIEAWLRGADNSGRPRIRHFYGAVESESSSHRDALFRMKELLGGRLYGQAKDILEQLRKQDKARIRHKFITDTGRHLTHTTDLLLKNGRSLQPKTGKTQFGEEESDFVFATSNLDSRFFYAMRPPRPKADPERIAIASFHYDDAGNLVPFAVLSSVQEQSYTYFLPKESFEPVVSLDGKFGGEWVSRLPVRPLHMEENSLAVALSRVQTYLLRLPQQEKLPKDTIMALADPHQSRGTLEYLQKEGFVTDLTAQYRADWTRALSPETCTMRQLFARQR